MNPICVPTLLYHSKNSCVTYSIVIHITELLSSYSTLLWIQFACTQYTEHHSKNSCVAFPHSMRVSIVANLPLYSYILDVHI